MWHLHAQVHRGYLDDPRNTDNAWVETVAISVHFDTQNDVEMKRLNSVRGCHPVGHPITPGPQEPDLQTQIATALGFSGCMRWGMHGDEHGVAPQCVPQKERAGGWGLEVMLSMASSPRVTSVPLQFLQGCDPELCIRWQVLDKRIPLHANHKELLHKVSTLLGAYY